MERIGIRELRQHASRYLARVAAGETIEVTDRGRPVARLVPSPAEDDDLLARMEADGMLIPALNHGPLPPIVAAKVLGASASEILRQMRDDER
ncbi:MAG: hypothetical protein QOG52_2788 [Frankiaceae bacterium]|jgi:prevent-host-death family protein|nr:hypothetical protein [Frankiaceae bacterium]